MNRLSAFVLSCVAAASFALADAPKPELVQGLYEGAYKSQGDHKFEVRVVAVGKGNYKIYIRENLADGKVNKIELNGKTDGDAVNFTGKSGDAAWSGAYADAAVKGTCGADGTFEMKRIVRESPTMGAKPPAGAIVLLDGKNFDEMTCKPVNGKEQEWKVVEDGAIQVPKGGMNSKRTFAGSYKTHVEFRCPLMPEANGQGRANSGCYQTNGEEIQVLDSFGMTTYTGGACGGLYRWKEVDAFDEFPLASAPPLQWQTYDIEYRVQMKDGKPTGKPKITVIHNGIKIHDNVEMHNDAKVGTFYFQDHGNPVCFRNIWVLPLE